MMQERKLRLSRSFLSCFFADGTEKRNAIGIPLLIVLDL